MSQLYSHLQPRELTHQMSHRLQRRREDGDGGEAKAGKNAPQSEQTGLFKECAFQILNRLSKQ